MFCYHLLHNLLLLTVSTAFRVLHLSKLQCLWPLGFNHHRLIFMTVNFLSWKFKAFELVRFLCMLKAHASFRNHFTMTWILSIKLKKDFKNAQSILLQFFGIQAIVIEFRRERCARGTCSVGTKVWTVNIRKFGSSLRLRMKFLFETWALKKM